MSLRRALPCLAALATLAACQRPPPAQEAPPAAAQQAPQPTSESPMPPEAPSSPPPDADGGAPQALLLKDSGVRCITFPCPSYSVQAEGAAEPREVHELDLSALPSDAEREHVQRALERGVRVEGTLGVRTNAGPAGDATVLRVTRLLK